MELREMGKAAKDAARYLNSLGVTEKNEGLRQAAQALLDGQDAILEANAADVEAARGRGMHSGLIDRLTLTPARIRWARCCP